jgi:hypothetical protein
MKRRRWKAKTPKSGDSIAYGKRSLIVQKNLAYLGHEGVQIKKTKPTLNPYLPESSEGCSQAIG